MLQYAPTQKEQIGVILKYAANSNIEYNIWDEALGYYESLDTNDLNSKDDVVVYSDEEDDVSDSVDVNGDGNSDNDTIDDDDDIDLQM